MSDIPTRKEEECQEFLKLEKELNITDVPIQNSSEQSQAEKGVPDKQNEDKDNDSDDRNLPEQSTGSKLVPDEKNAAELTHELSKTTEESGSQDESGLVHQ